MTILGHKARNHPQQIAQLGVDDSIDDRRTPAQLFRELHHVHGFTLDAAASPENALLSTFFTREMDGLAQSWAPYRVWCNPPYSDCGSWVDKAWRAVRAGCSLVVMLLPANRTEQDWWQQLVEPFRDRIAGGGGIRLTTRFLGGRMRFGRPPGTPVPKKGDRPPFGLVLLTWEPVE